MGAVDDLPIPDQTRVANIGRLLSAAAQRHPGRIALRQDGRTLTYAELNERVDALARGLFRLGLTTGDRVVIWMQNGLEYLETMFACWKLGLAVVPMNIRLTAAEVSFHVSDCAARVLLHDGSQPGADAIEVEHRIGVGIHGGRAYEDLLAGGDAGEQARDLPEDTPAWVFYTSGTTGRPKGAILTHRNLLFLVVAWCADLHPYRPDDTVLHCAPLSHGAGFHALVGLARGAENLVHQRWDPKTFCAAVERYGVTVAWLVPTQIRMLLDSEALDSADLSTLKCVIYGGSPMHREDLQEARERLGPVLCQIYAQGETPMTLTYLPPAEHDMNRPDAHVLTSAGTVRTGMELRIVGPDDLPLPPGEVGEIVARGPAVMAGYWRRPDATAETLRHGWLHTGDLGRLDEHGYLYVLDRMKDFIISGGANVYAREVEDVLVQHPRIREAAVFGVPDRLWGEAVTAAVIGDIEAEEVITFCKQHMADYKRPKRVHICAELPKNAYGKVLKRELRELHAPAAAM